MLREKRDKKMVYENSSNGDADNANKNIKITCFQF